MPFPFLAPLPFLVPAVSRAVRGAVGMRQPPWLPGAYLKDSSVNVANLSPEIRRALATMRDVLSALGAGPLVITSGNDGPHLPGSLHYVNDAVDVRSMHIPARAQRERVGKTMALAIGATLKLSGGPPVGKDPGFMLWVEERPDSVPHFHLELRRAARPFKEAQTFKPRAPSDARASGAGSGLLVLAALGLTAYALSQWKP